MTTDPMHLCGVRMSDGERCTLELGHWQRGIREHGEPFAKCGFCGGKGTNEPKEFNSRCYFCNGTGKRMRVTE